MNLFLKTVLIGTLSFGVISYDQQNKEKESPIKEENVTTNKEAKRYGWVIKVKPEKLDYYKELHANPWPEVLEQISKSNIRNYSIYLKDDHLFGYFEYTGNDFAGDMAKMAEDSVTRQWWKETDPCQEPLDSRQEGEWWASMEEVFHHD